MNITFDNLGNLKKLKNLSATLRTVVTHKSLPRSENYLKLEHQNINQWIREYESVKGEVNSQRYAKYDRNGELTSYFTVN